MAGKLSSAARQRIRTGGYRPKEYTHELVAIV
jgi:hypothetical protein